jgi:RNA polymerase sigma-70 factor, ECF subfamily
MSTLQTMQAAYSTESGKFAGPGDVDRLTAVASKYSPTLHKMAFRKLRNREDAEDAVQDGLLLAFRNMHQFRGQAQLSSWVGSIVLNSAKMQLRRRANRNLVPLDFHEADEPYFSADPLRDPAPDPEEALRRRQRHETLRRATEKLPACLRVAFCMRIFDGLSTSEAATALGVPEGTLKARFFRARTKITATLRRARQSARMAKP